MNVFNCISSIFCLQKARLARIRIAKASSGAAFVSKKKAAEARMAAQESGLEIDENYREEDIFEIQHHHLLRCLEKTTVSEWRTGNATAWRRHWKWCNGGHFHNLLVLDWEILANLKKLDSTNCYVTCPKDPRTLFEYWKWSCSYKIHQLLKKW